ncbi:MAG: hypothetical protein E7071_03195 [Bacteroidales bacterium]|nr:hypothetical protein [Bacteroidales bacterium]
MRYITTIICIFYLSFGCSNDKYFDIDNICLNSIEKNDIILHTNNQTKNIYFHSHTQAFIKETADPYSITNIRRAYNELKKSGICKINTEINPTHYVLKLYPRNMQELSEIENINEINISYIPYNFSYLSIEQEELLDKDIIYDTIKDDSKYHIIYEFYDDKSNNRFFKRISMPVIYATWPIDKELPTNYEYEVNYEIFNPYYKNKAQSKYINNFTRDDIKKIENKAIQLTLKDNNIERTANNLPEISGEIFYKDYTLNRTPPLHNLKVKFQLGSVSWEIYTSSNGSFIIRDSIPKEATFNMIFFHPKWKITKEESATPITYNNGTIEELWGNTTHHRVAYKLSSRPVFECHCAVNHFYYSNHGITKPTSSNGIRIEASKITESDTNGYFLPSQTNMHIRIINKHRDNTARVIATTLHEIGHYAMYMLYNDRNAFINGSRLIKESWASYCGWYLCREYYKKYNYTEEDSLYSFTKHEKQSWEKTGDSTQCYSPLFIDLQDTYNQVYCIGKNNDVIENITPAEITNIAQTYKTWTTLKSGLYTHLSTKYTIEEINSYIEPYDYWYNTNNVKLGK